MEVEKRCWGRGGSHLAVSEGGAMRSRRAGRGDAVEEVVSEGGMAAWGGSRRGRKGRVSREKGGVVGRSCGDEVGGRDALKEEKKGWGIGGCHLAV